MFLSAKHRRSAVHSPRVARHSPEPVDRGSSSPPCSPAPRAEGPPSPRLPSPPPPLRGPVQFRVCLALCGSGALGREAERQSRSPTERRR